MSPARKISASLVGLGSVVLHVAVLALLATQNAKFRTIAPPPPIFDVTLAPRYLVEPNPPAAHSPSPLRPRPPIPQVEAPFVTPLVTPLPPRIPAEPTVATVPDLTARQLGRALRGGGMGCQNPDLTALTVEERARCQERLGAGAKSATYRGLGLDAKKQVLFDQAGAAKAAVYREREGPLPAGFDNTPVGREKPIPDTKYDPKTPRHLIPGS